MTRETVAAATEPAAPASAPPARGPGWWGMVLLVATEATFFACLLASYFYVRFSRPGGWPPDGIRQPELTNALVMTAALVVSGAFMEAAARAAGGGRRGRRRGALVLSLLLGLVFLAVQGVEYASNLGKFTWTTNAYGSLFYTITGFHGLHVAVGVVMLAVVALRGGYGPVRLVSIYWYFVAATWLVTLFVLYLSPRL